MVAVVGQVAKAARDDVADALGNLQPRSASVEPSLRRQQPHDLPDEERIAFGLLLDRVHQFVSRRLAGDEFDEAATSRSPSPPSAMLLLSGSRTSSVIAAVNGSVGVGSTFL